MSAAQNRFDFLRLFFAFGVFAYHAVTLTALDPLGPLETWLGILAEVSVQGFFHHFRAARVWFLAALAISP